MLMAELARLKDRALQSAIINPNRQSAIAAIDNQQSEISNSV
jgi:hypothetical protein